MGDNAFNGYDDDDDDFDFGEDGLLVPSTSLRAKYEADMERLFRTSLQA